MDLGGESAGRENNLCNSLLHDVLMAAGASGFKREVDNFVGQWL